MRNRRVLRFIAVAAGILLLLLVAVLIFLRTPPAKRLVLDQIRKALATQGVVLEAVNFDFGLVPLRVSTGRVSIRSALAPDLPTLFVADHFTAEIGLSDLIGGRYRIEDLTVAN